MFTQAARQHPRLASQPVSGTQSKIKSNFQLEPADGSPGNFHSLSPSTGDSAESASSSSLSNADSDSLLRSMARQQLPANPRLPAETGKSPVLIKYNYYDYNGARQEQANHDMNFNLTGGNQQANNQERLQRHLSPAFKQNLDQIVSQQLQAVAAVASASGGSGSPSPEGQLAALQLARRYKLSSYEQRCLRCNKTVYQMDKVGPLKDFTFYHQNCFKCRACGTKLTLKTYFNNQQSSGDQEVYCHRHCPKTGPGRLDNQSVGIRAALNAPKVFEQHAPTGSEFLELRHSPLSPGGGQQRALPVNVDASALYIQHAVRQTRLQNNYRQQSPQDSKISQFINRRLEFLEPKQKMLEMRHREEEDALFKAFELKWRQEEKSISEQIRDEWQLELEKLLDKYKRQLDEIGQQAATKRLPSAPSAGVGQEPPKRMKSLLLKQLQTNANHQENNNLELSEQQMIEFERMNLEKTMTIKLDRKKETLKRKLKEFERQATAELVEKQSREMLALISIKLDEFKEEQKRKIGSDLEQFEAIESLANQLDSSLQLGRQPPAAFKSSAAGKSSVGEKSSRPARSKPLAGSAGEPAFELPPPSPPQVSKMELYNNEEPDEVFKEIDELAINVAREDQRTFTELVHHLTRKCLSDVAKVRAIFRWITVKNLNTMQFDSSVKPDTPLGLLRGIKNGSESYHVLFKRLCSYAGLHCVVIKGYSKSAGYQPGIRFEGNRFRNSWNAVYVAGAWRFVQCNWGARHLVSVAVMQDKNSKQPVAERHAGRLPAAAGSPLAQPATGNNQNNANQPPSPANLGRRGLKASPGGHHLADNRAGQPEQRSPRRSPPAGSGGAQKHQQQAQQNDSLRYEYDDHYFLTDPDEFIYEFFPLAPEWQLIRSSRPIALSDFEQLPFVRSLFFKYGLYFPQPHIRSVLQADSSGATTIKIGMPTHMIPSLIFHYNLKFYDNDTEHYDGVSLKRFVMQSVESGSSELNSPSSSSSNNANNPNNAQVLLSNIVSFRVHLPENGSYILDIFANSTTPTQYITGEPMKFKSVCKFKIIAKNLKTVMIPLPDCASGEYGPLKATRLFGIIPITHENGLISVTNDKRFLEIQFRMTRPLLDFMASLHKNGYDERQLSKSIKIFIDGDIVIITIKFFEDGQYGLDVYTRDQTANQKGSSSSPADADLERQPLPELNRKSPAQPKKQLLTHCCKYLINVKSPPAIGGRQ